MHVELEKIGAEGQRVAEGEQAVVRPEQCAAPVRGEERGDHALRGRGDGAHHRGYREEAQRQQERPPHFSVSTSPFTNHRCMSRMTATGGSIASIAVDMIRFQSVWASPVPIILVMPMTMVSMLLLVVIRSGHRYWFQPYRKRMTNSAAILVRESGSRMWRKKRRGPAPSILAASTSSSGMVMKNCRKSRVAVAEAISGRVSPPNVLTRWRSDTTVHGGMIRTSTGSIRVMKIIQKNTMRSGKT